jgi:formate-dependent nitrite reductase cytochrome c552 subunit
MNQNFVLANQSRSQSLLPLKLALKQAKLYSPPDSLQSQVNAEEQLASELIETIKKSHRRPSPFAMWTGQPFPHEYKEMVAADVR